LIWHWLTKDAESEDDVAKLEHKIYQPPAGVEVTTGPWSAEAEMAAFKGLKASLTS
jgi:hypothetical protein